MYCSWVLEIAEEEKKNTSRLVLSGIYDSPAPETEPNEQENEGVSLHSWCQRKKRKEKKRRRRRRKKKKKKYLTAGAVWDILLSSAGNRTKRIRERRCSASQFGAREKKRKKRKEKKRRRRRKKKKKNTSRLVLSGIYYSPAPETELNEQENEGVQPHSWEPTKPFSLGEFRNSLIRWWWWWWWW